MGLIIVFQGRGRRFEEHLRSVARVLSGPGHQHVQSARGQQWHVQTTGLLRGGGAHRAADGDGARAAAHRRYVLHGGVQQWDAAGHANLRPAARPAQNGTLSHHRRPRLRTGRTLKVSLYKFTALLPIFDLILALNYS